MKVCMFVYNNCKNDARVLKEANSLTEAGFDVRIIAVLDKVTLPFEQRGGFRIIRVQVVSPLKRIIRRLAEIPFFQRIYKIIINLVKPLVGFVRKIVLVVSSFSRRAMVNLFGAVFEDTVGNKPRRREERQEKSEKILRRLRFLAVQIHDPATALNRETTRRTDEYKPGRVNLITWLVIRCKQSFVELAQIIQTAIRADINKDYVKEMRRYPWFFFSIGWSILLSRFIVMTLGKLIGFVDRFYHDFAMFPVYLSYYRSAFRIVKGEPAVVYHAHDLNTLPVAYCAARRHKANLVYDSHELYLERNRMKSLTAFGKYLRTRVESFLIRRAQIVITVNQSIANILAERYKIPTPHVVLNAPSGKKQELLRDTAFSHLGLKLRLNDTKSRLVLYLGRVTFNRGLEKAIESMLYLPDCHLVFMGFAPDYYKKSLQVLARRLGVEKRCSFLEPVPVDQITVYAADADVGIAAIENVCLSYYYCSPNKIFEYINSGLPVVSSNFPELKNVVEGYNIGKTFDPDDPMDIAKAINDVLSDYEEFKQNVQKAAWVFNWENESKKLLSIYQTLESS